jgi:ubiquinone/menaquinone biosynthesis C-methylase UbiE
LVPGQELEHWDPAALGRVVGVDLSPEMLALAPRGESVAYVAGAGEALPLAGERFDLVTVASAFHWLDRERFLAEARRVLVESGWLAVAGRLSAAGRRRRR